MIIILMGVAGSGKTTIGRLLAGRLGWTFVDGDDLHPPDNVAKMAAGKPLTDEDRWPWLRRVGAAMEEFDESGVDAVIACSALRQSYRDLLHTFSDSVGIVYLRGSRSTILSRMHDRSDHFMPPDLLDSQFEALEEPADAIVVDIERKPSEVVDHITAQLAP